jgi:hypothetical protein
MSGIHPRVNSTDSKTSLVKSGRLKKAPVGCKINSTRSFHKTKPRRGEKLIADE